MGRGSQFPCGVGCCGPLLFSPPVNGIQSINVVVYVSVIDTDLDWLRVFGTGPMRSRPVEGSSNSGTALVGVSYSFIALL